MDKTSPNEEETQKAKHHYLSEFLGKFFKELNRPRFLVEVLALVGLFIYVCETHRMNSLASHNFIVDQRPWIIAHSGQWVIQKDKIVEMYTWFHNAGKTPAMDVHATNRIEVVSSQDIPSFDDYPKPLSASFSAAIMYPGQETPHTNSIALLEEIAGTNQSKGVILNDELLDRYNRRQIVFVAYGQAIYRDAFGIERWTHFCFYQENSGTFVTNLPNAAKKCSEYNNADNN